MQDGLINQKKTWISLIILLVLPILSNPLNTSLLVMLSRQAGALIGQNPFILQTSTEHCVCATSIDLKRS